MAEVDGTEFLDDDYLDDGRGDVEPGEEDSNEEGGGDGELEHEADFAVPHGRGRGRKPGGGRGRGRGPQRPNPKAKAKSKAKAKGNKHCRGCNSWLSRESFPPGSAYCIIDKKVVQNLRYAAQTQGKLDWYQEVLNDDKLILKACQNYKVRCLEIIALDGQRELVATGK